MTRLANLASLLLCAQIVLFSPVDIWARNSEDFTFAGIYSFALLGVVFVVTSGVMLAAIWISPRRWRSALALLLTPLALLVWFYANFTLQGSMQLSGRVQQFDLGSRLGGWELVCILALLAIGAWLVKWRPKAALLVICILLVGQTTLTAFHIVDRRAHGIAPYTQDISRLADFSPRGNVLVVLLDTLQSDVALDAIASDSTLRGKLSGFTLFRNTTGVATTTYPSMIAIHTGKTWDPGLNLADQYDTTIKPNSFMAQLGRAGYESTFINPMKSVCPTGGTRCAKSHAILQGDLANLAGEATILLDFSLLRVSPYLWKSSLYDSGSFRLLPLLDKLLSRDTHESLDLKLLNTVASRLTAGSDRKTVKFLHVMTTHAPFAMDRSCRIGDDVREDGALNAAHCALEGVTAIFSELKARGLYDQSLIIVTADHGGMRALKTPELQAMKTHSPSQGFLERAGVASPMLMLKPPNASEPFAQNVGLASVTDIPKTICAITGDCATAEGMSLVDVALGKTRSTVRTFRNYDWKHEYWDLSRISDVTSYTITGPTWNTASWHQQYAAPDYILGQVIHLTSSASPQPSCNHFCREGWSTPEPQSTWTDGETATLKFGLQAQPESDLTLRVTAAPFLSPAHPRQKVRVLANGTEVGVWEMSTPSIQELEVTIPKALAFRPGDLDVSFVFDAPVSPAESGVGSDTRLLGLSVTTLVLEKAAPSPPPKSSVREYQLGTVIDFKSGSSESTCVRYCGEGWARPEPQGTWTDGEMATLRLGIRAQPKSDLTLRITAAPFLTPAQSRQKVHATVNGVEVGVWNMAAPAMQDWQVVIPEAIAFRTGDLDIAFGIETPVSPATAGLGADTRRLGISLAALVVDKSAPPTLTPTPPPLPNRAYQLGTVIDFKSGTSAVTCLRFCSRGWSVSENFGTWTDGDIATLQLELQPDAPADLTLRVKAAPFLNASTSRQNVRVMANGVEVGKWSMDSPSAQNWEIEIPKAVAFQRPLLQIEFMIEKPMSPSELGLTGDTRRLGIGVEEVQLRN